MVQLKSQANDWTNQKQHRKDFFCCLQVVFVREWDIVALLI